MKRTTANLLISLREEMLLSVETRPPFRDLERLANLSSTLRRHILLPMTMVYELMPGYIGHELFKANI